MEYVFLLFTHIFFGIVWAGGAITAGFFIIPAALEAGPAGGAVIAGIMRRRFATLMTASGFLVVLSGLRLYMLRFSGEWLASPNGIVLSLGGLLGVAAFLMGVFVQKPTAERLAELGARVAASGGPADAEQAAELDALRARLGKIARVTAWHLLAAVVLMAGQRLSAAL